MDQLGLIFGLFLGLILDSITLDNNFTQIPGLILCEFGLEELKYIVIFWLGILGMV